MSLNTLVKLMTIIIGYGEVMTPNIINVCPIEEFTEEPLILTPFIESGNIEEAQNLSLVNLKGFEDIKSHSGYFTVNQVYNSNLFFWYFVAENLPKDAPVILWLQGGPGMSSLYGLFHENGPFVANGKYLEKRIHSWNKNYHLLYIDNPIGTGFSTTNGIYSSTLYDVASGLYSALKQFFILFPDLKNNDFYITGESYAGKYIPVISHMIHKKNMKEDIKINLQGLAIGNGYTNPNIQFQKAELYHQIGLIDTHQMEKFLLFEKIHSDCLKDGKVPNCELITHIRVQSTSSTCFTHQSTGFHSDYNLLNPYHDWYLYEVENLLMSSDIRKSLHVGFIKIDKTKQIYVNLHLSGEYKNSVTNLISELLSHYRVLVYNGMLDLNVPYRGSEDYLMNMSFTGHEEFKKAPKMKWIVNGEVAGYSKSGGNLSSVVIRNSGHSVPVDQPEWMMELLNRFINNDTFY